MPEDSQKAIESLLQRAAPARRRFLKQLLAGTSALAFLALPATSALAQDPPPGEGKGKGKGKGKGRRNEPPPDDGAGDVG